MAPTPYRTRAVPDERVRDEQRRKVRGTTSLASCRIFFLRCFLVCVKSWWVESLTACSTPERPGLARRSLLQARAAELHAQVVGSVMTIFEARRHPACLAVIGTAVEVCGGAASVSAGAHVRARLTPWPRCVDWRSQGSGCIRVIALTGPDIFVLSALART